MGNFPGFFKVYLSTSSPRLPLPLALCSILKGAEPRRCFLRRSLNGKLWPVRLARYEYEEGDKWYFDDGWTNFIEVNNVKVGDFFVFDYVGNSTFHFKHLGGDRCGKTVTTSSSPTETKKKLPDYIVLDETSDDDDDDDEEDTEGEDEDENTDDSDDDDDEDYHKEEDDDEMIAEHLQKQRFGKTSSKRSKAANSIGGGRPSYYDFDNVVVDDDDDDDESSEKAGEPKRKRKRPRSKCYCGSERRKSAEPKFKQPRPSSSYNEDEEDIFQYGLIIPPKNPHFVAKHMQKRPGYLHIPGDVISVYNLKIPESLKLLDEQGRQWTARVKFWKDGRIWISKGWRAFCKWNRLRAEDRCICEFILHRNVGHHHQKLVHQLKMRIVRNWSWLPKPAAAAAAKNKHVIIP